MIKIQLKHGRKKIRNMISLLTALIMFFSVSHQTYSQTGSNDNGSNQGEEPQVTLNLQDVDILVLINTVAEVSGKNFIVDPRVKGKVSVISGASLNPDELYDVFLSILEVHNFATVDSGSVVKVLPSNVIKQRPTPTLFSPTEDTNDSQITQIIQLDHASVQDLVPIIRPLIPPSSHFAPHIGSNSVVVTDTAANIQRVLKIIRRIDVPDKRANTRIIYLDHARASDLAASLTQLLAASAGAGGQAAGVQPPSIAVQPLDAINALLITATDDEYAKIQALIDQLDIERELASDVNVIYLKHANATDLVSILNDVTASSAEGVVSDFSVQADEATNSLIVKASAGQLKAVKGVVEKLDLRRAQVFVETIIAEVSLMQQANLGIDVAAGGPRTLLGGTTAATPADGDGDGAGATPATTASTVGNIVSRTNPNQIIGTGSVAFNGSGLNFSLLNFDRFNINLILTALRQDNNSNVLSTPTLLTLDNETAEIVVGQEVPFVTGQFNNGFNNSTTVDADGNAVGGTTGSSFQTIERRDVGILLRITPQISDGDTIQLEVLQEISSVAPTEISGQADLITNTRSIETVVQVDDGQVIALGGLLQDDVTDSENRVPFLGRLPVLGRLFKTTTKAANKSNLMVFLKPRIIRTADQLAKYSKGKYDAIRLDTQLARLKSSDFFIDDGELPVLDDYKNVADDGSFTYEQRRELIEKYKKGVPKRRGLPALIFGKGRQPNSSLDDDDFTTEGELDDAELQRLERIERDLREEEGRIDWGSDSNRIPQPSRVIQPDDLIKPAEVQN